MKNTNTRRGNTHEEKDIVICPPCGESAALAAKGGQNKGNALWPLLPRLTALLPQSGKTYFTIPLPGYAVLPLKGKCFLTPPYGLAGHFPRKGDRATSTTAAYLPQGGQIERHNSNSVPQRRKITTRGFTLIELLVVVLIIGILAAVAVPQYNKAVLKSRFAQVELNMRTLALAAEACQLSKGSPCTKEELDIDVTDCKPIPGLIDTECSYELYSSGSVYLIGQYHNQLCAYWFTKPDNLLLKAHTLYCWGGGIPQKMGFIEVTGTVGPTWYTRP